MYFDLEFAEERLLLHTFIVILWIWTSRMNIHSSVLYEPWIHMKTQWCSGVKQVGI